MLNDQVALRVVFRFVVARHKVFFADSNARKALGRASSGFSIVCDDVIIPRIS
jgi:hypothetical protein